jgi:RHS repeat-associated protein
MIFEIKGGTWQPENTPGKVIFDNFQFGSNNTSSNPPTVTSISPNTGSTNGGNSVTITGTGFSEGATVSFGGSSASNVSIVNSSYITATTPAHSAGTVNVVVTNPDAQSGTLNNGFTYNAGSSSETVLIVDDFNDNSLDTAKWDGNNLFSGYTESSLPLAETNHQLEIGPLLQQTSDSRYRGIRTVNSYSFNDSYSYVELVQAPLSTTKADAMFTVGNSVDAYYRLYVENGTLYGLRKSGGVKTTLFTLSYDTVNHRFLRIRHDANTGNVTLDTAPGNNGVPGTWVQRYSEAWNSAISLTGMIFEIKGGTWQPENTPGKVIFDNFKAASNSQANQTPLANPGGPYIAVQNTSVQLNGSSSYDPDGTIENYQWNFGDGIIDSGPAPEHTYGAAGTYIVTLTVTDNGGLTSTGSTTVTIYPATNQLPVAHIAGPYSAVTGTSTQFSASGSFDPDGSIAQYKWDFAGLGTGAGPTANFTFTNIGIHVVTLTVTDNWGAKSRNSINVTVGVPPGGDNILGDSNVSDWDAVNRKSLDDPTNDPGNPPNKATGNNNFQLVAPVLSLPGRGIDLNLNLVYNSLVWNTTGNGSGMYFDIDHDWPAPGWHLGFGKMVAMGTAGALLIEPDGSRHAFTGTVFTYRYPATQFRGAVDVPTFKGQTIDGSLIEYRCEMSGQPYGLARYPDGTQVYYTNYSTDFSKPKNYLYPYLIVDANGNRLNIKYLWDLAEPRIERIVDSVGRVIAFHYDTQKRLTSITAPGLRDANGSATTYTFVRLHYRTEPLNLIGAFSGSIHVRNSSPQVIDAIYYPATGTGFWFGSDAYSSYGMLKKVTQERGMGFSAGSSPDEQGTVSEGTVSHIQTYDYPATPANLTSAPVFSSITETWDGSMGSTATGFVVQDNSTTSERTVTVTNPDLTKTVQISFSLNNLAESDPDKFKNGLTKEERRLDKNGTVIQKTVFTWEKGANGAPRLLRTETADELSQVLATAYDQYGENNAVGRVREFDYAGAVFRSTLNTFVSYQDSDLESGINPTLGGFRIIHPRRINLVASTKIFEGDDSANKLAAYTVTKFDEYAEPLKAYTPDISSSTDLFEFGESRQPGGITGILQHSTSFNPLPPSNTSPYGGAGANYLTNRGNITSITRYADTSNPAAPASPLIEKMKYDMAGNVISSSKICCEELSSNFENLATQYAFPISQTRGSPDPSSLVRVTTNTTYDLNTGLPRLVTNANGRPTQTNYYPESWRPKEIISATGSIVSFEYDDAAMKVTEITRLSANGTIAGQTTKYFNGLGQVKKEEALGANGAIDIVETRYDEFGRPSQQSLPYRTGQTPQWRQTIYDAAGRVSERWEPTIEFRSPGEGNPKTKYFYNDPIASRPAGASNEPGQTTRTVDAWSRWRYVRLNAAGRLAEVVEPNPAGGTGFQTKYSYNALNKLMRSEQGDTQTGVQVRRFRYDSLGRLTRQKLAETEATLDLFGRWSTAGIPDDRWSDVYTYDERSNLISHTDARGVKTTFNYKDSNNADDPLNRLHSVSYDLSGVPGTLTVSPAATVSYDYRPKSSTTAQIDVTQIKQIIAAGVSTEDYDYDTEGRVQEKRLTFAGRTQPMTTTYAYDSLGRIDTITYPEQFHDNVGSPIRKIVKSNYDPASRLTGIKVNNVDYASLITYNAFSQITSVLIGSGPNQLAETYRYQDRTGLLVNQSVKRGTTTLMEFGYGYTLYDCDDPGAQCIYDPVLDYHTGQLTTVTNGHWTQRFSYDDLGRLKTADQHEWIEQFDSKGNPTGIWQRKIYWTENYSYDRYGNRTSVSASNNTGTTPVAQDGIASVAYDTTSNRITSAGFSYDPAGNQLQNNTGQSFIYDAAGRLVKVKNQSGTTLATYTYGDSNQRLIAQTGSETSTDKTYYLWEGNSVIAEYVEQTSATMPKWSRNYIYLGGRLLATEEPNGTGEIVRYHHPNRLGTKLITNNQDTSSVQQATLPFGTLLDTETTASTAVTNRRFTSYDRSATTGLDYAVNRHYDPRQGRFTQPDLLGMAAANLADPQSLNMYSYVGNDPVNRIDPDGQFWGALLQFIVGLFKNLKPNVINGSFTYHNAPPISVSFTPNFQNIGVAFAGIGFNLRSNGHWLPAVLGSRESLDPQNPLSSRESDIIQDSINRASELLSNPDCLRFVDNLLQKAAAARNQRWWASPEKFIEIDGFYPGVGAIAGHNMYADLFARGGITATGVSGRHGDFITYGVTVSATGAVRWNTEFFGLSRNQRGRHNLHESLHQFAGFDDEILANAARAALGLSRRDFSTERDPVGAASSHLNELIERGCGGGQ